MAKKVIRLTEMELSNLIEDTIAKARRMEKEVQPYWLQEYVGKTFKFYGEDRLGLVVHVLFTFEKVTKLDLNKTVLVGTVTFDQTQISGDGIIIDFVKNRVLYHEKGNRYAYKLEIDNRTSQLWNRLLSRLKHALENRNEQPK